MLEPTLFGISKPQWDLLNGFANWFSAAGSFAAAAIALYLANRAGKPSAKISVGHRIIVGPGGEPYPEFVVFHIVNTGDRPIRVIQLGWKAGLFRKHFSVQLYDSIESSALPVELSHGQEAKWFVPLASASREEPWLEFFARRMLLPHYRTGLWTLKAQIYSSVGCVFEARPEEGLFRMLQEACKSVKRKINEHQ